MNQNKPKKIIHFPSQEVNKSLRIFGHLPPIIICKCNSPNYHICTKEQTNMLYELKGRLPASPWQCSNCKGITYSM